MINLNKDTLFNEDDQEEKKGGKEKKEEEEELDLEEEDILPIEETGGGGRKILWTIVVLIIIGLGIYSFAKREQIREGLKTPKEEREEIAEGAKDTAEEFTWKGPEEKEEGKEPTVEEGEGQTIIKEAALPQLEEFTAGEEKREIAQTETPAAEKEAEAKITVEEDKFIVTAGKGEGITHLARRALTEYLEKSGRQQEVNNEQKIFIEDYLQNQTGNEWLSLGEQKTFTVGQISEAIDASKKLDEKQLQNLEKYSQVVFGS